MSDSEEKQIKSDDEWKERVKAEDAALDEKSTARDNPATQEQPAAADSASSDSASQQIPPADFTTLVTMFSTQAMVSLSLIPGPMTDQPETNLPLAKHFIDLLGVLEEKTKRNLTGHEAQLLETSLHELRMAYVQKTSGTP